jgi:hypothetical protein
MTNGYHLKIDNLIETPILLMLITWLKPQFFDVDNLIETWCW